MKERIPVLTFDQVVDRLLALRRPYTDGYLAMYSSWYGGIVTAPSLMMVPIDDHLVHRGDGIFEAFKCVDWKVYGLDRHLDRLERSAGASFLTCPLGREDLKQAILETVRAAGKADCTVRLLLSRGPGGFTPNPYECPSNQIYIVVTASPVPGKEKYEKGVTLKSSRVPIKKAYFANIKSCNYLPNVLMKKEAVDAGVDYTISIDDHGFLGEGSTENFGLITPEGELLVPRFDRVLRGTTVSRLMELAEGLVGPGGLARVGEADLTPALAYGAAEMMAFGTSFDVLPVVEFDGHRIGEGTPGPFFRKLLDLLREDMRTCAEMLTPVPE